MARTKTTAKKQLDPTKTKAARMVPGNKVSKKSAPIQKEKKPHRFKPGIVALRQIKKYQKGGELLLKKAPFGRLVRKIATGINANTRFTLEAIEGLHHSVEGGIVNLLEAANKTAIHAKRLSLQPKDIDLVGNLLQYCHGDTSHPLLFKEEYL